MAPPEKRQKMESCPAELLPAVHLEAKERKIAINDPVVFTSASKNPDIRVQVFTKTFLVNSIVLRSVSKFFDKLLGDFVQAEDTKPPRPAQTFRYEWIARSEENGSWTLSSNTKHQNSEIPSFNGNHTNEENAFNNLLCAVFHRPYKIADCTELITMTDLAGRFSILPILSNYLSGALYNRLNSASIAPGIRKDQCSMLVAAYRLRNKVLYKECFIHVLSPWSRPRYKQVNEYLLRELAQTEYKNMESIVLNLHNEILNTCATGAGQQLMELARYCVDENGKVMLPSYFRECYRIGFEGKRKEEEDIKRLLKEVLDSNLELDRDDAVAGDDSFIDFFLCFDVSVYPWDEEELEW